MDIPSRHPHASCADLVSQWPVGQIGQIWGNKNQAVRLWDWIHKSGKCGCLRWFEDIQIQLISWLLDFDIGSWIFVRTQMSGMDSKIFMGIFMGNHLIFVGFSWKIWDFHRPGSDYMWVFGPSDQGLTSTIEVSEVTLHGQGEFIGWWRFSKGTSDDFWWVILNWSDDWLILCASHWKNFKEIRFFRGNGYFSLRTFLAFKWIKSYQDLTITSFGASGVNSNIFTSSIPRLVDVPLGSTLGNPARSNMPRDISRLIANPNV